MKRFILSTLLFLLLTSIWSFELIELTDAPTAGILQKGEVRMYSKLYRENGLNLGTQVGLFPRFMFGVSYGGEQIVGNQEPNYHKRVEFNAKFRLFDESSKMVAIVLGFDSQGHGRYYNTEDRYDIKSKGFYLTASRNFSLLGAFGIHGGLNYSLEDSAGDNDLSYFLGFDKSIANMIVFTAEYDFAINDNEEKFDIPLTIEGEGKGYLNAGINIKFTDSISLKISARDLLENSPNTLGMDRSITFNYTTKF
ncbi:MAG: hypothetical protein U9N34_07085 [Candidatus Cloacimonadota bacterium]|nr:hypothetical protein [Candidatus Cloacimonadota bacterium]